MAYLRSLRRMLGFLPGATVAIIRIFPVFGNSPERSWKMVGRIVPRALFEECLNIHAIGVAKLTTGLFWIAPAQVLPLPATTVQYLKARGIAVDVTSKATYDAVMNQVRSQLSSDFIMESHNAWLYCRSEEDLNFDFPDGLKDGVWNAFRKGFPDFVDFRSPGEKFQKDEIAYKRAGLSKFEKLGGRAEIERRLAANDPAAALEVITKFGGPKYRELPVMAPEFRGRPAGNTG